MKHLQLGKDFVITHVGQPLNIKHKRKMFTLNHFKSFVASLDMDLEQEGCYIGVGYAFGALTSIELTSRKMMENGIFKDYMFCYLGFDGFDDHSIESTYDEIVDWYNNP